jgi:hypothetical protein
MYFEWFYHGLALNSHAHKVISRFVYFQKTFKSGPVLMKWSGVLDAELNFDSNGSSVLSIKNHKKSKE